MKLQRIVFIILALAVVPGLGDESTKKKGPFLGFQEVKKEVKPTIRVVTIQVPEVINSEKMLERQAVLVTYPDAVATIVMCHGFMCDKYDMGFLRTMFPAGRYNFISFDFRGHGDNAEGQICTFGKNEKLEVQAVARFIKSQPEFKDKPLLVYGFSMGAVSAIEAQAYDNTLFDAMILDCPFDSSENLIKQSLDKVKISWFGYEFDLPCRNMFDKYAFHPTVQTLIKGVLKAVGHMDPKSIDICLCPVDPAESIKKINVPCLFIHCINDDKVPVDAIRKIYDNATCDKILWLTLGRRHFDSIFYLPELYKERLLEFLNRFGNKQQENGEKTAIIYNDDELNKLWEQLQ